MMGENIKKSGNLPTKNQAALTGASMIAGGLFGGYAGAGLANSLFGDSGTFIGMMLGSAIGEESLRAFGKSFSVNNVKNVLSSNGGILSKAGGLLSVFGGPAAIAGILITAGSMVYTFMQE